MTRIIPFNPAVIHKLSPQAPKAAAQANMPRVSVPAKAALRVGPLPSLHVPAPLSAPQGGVPTISLQSFYPIYDLYGSRTVGVGRQGVESAWESVRLNGHAPYIVTTAFGLSDERGEMRVEIRDASDALVRAMLAGPGRLRATLSLVPDQTGLFKIQLTGQKIPGADSHVRIYGSYQIAVSQMALEADDGDAEQPASAQNLSLTW